MKNKILALTFLITATLLTACNNSNTTSSIVPNTEPQPESEIQVADNGCIYFYGEYILEGTIPDARIVYDRIIFFPDGRCYVHYSPQNEDRNSYIAYNYSYCPESNYVGFDAENASFEGFPSFSENKTLLKFDDYVLKLVENN